MRVILLALIAISAFAQKVDFTRDVQPLLNKRCIACHGDKLHINGLRFDDRESARRVLNSRLIDKVTGADGKPMPPSGPRLNEAEISTLKRWIDEGATWPASASRAKHWAWEPSRPQPADSTIDNFILARLAKEKVAPSPEADRRTLLRRASLDVTGLPPKPEETAEFLADTAPNAYEKQIDRLLASPHYGEKWARYWLDLAHYADSDGYEKDLVRPNAWRFRDWVIDAYNRDLPYDRFVTEQIAGDELPNATVNQRIATGFYRNTLTNREAGVDRTETRFEQLIDRVATTGTVFLGLTVRCAQCHDHKYDPIAQKDFYRILAYFHTADEKDIDAPLPGELGSYLRTKPEYDRKRAALLAEYNAAVWQAKWEDIMRDNMKNPGRNLDWDFQVTEIRAGTDHAERILLTPIEQRIDKDALRIQNRFLRNIGPLFKDDKPRIEKFKELRTKLDELEKTLAPLTEAPVMETRNDLGSAYIALRGDYKNHGPTVTPGAPLFLPGGDKGLPTRLDFAKWLTSASNPLTARVAVNRLWQELFGKGIVGTSEDFGTQGAKPSHPELLDYLATRYRALGFSQKAMLREMLLSSTYRQTSTVRKDLEAKDPENLLLARQARLRLPAELLRDEALAVSGLLNDNVGGPSIKPFQPAGVAELGYGATKKWNVSPGREQYRRGLYIHYQRTTPYPFLVNFDASDSVMACTRRQVSDTPLQAMDLLNDPVFFEAAGALAHRIETETGGSFRDRLDFAYRLVLNRKPTDTEALRLARYFDLQASEKSLSPWLAVSRVLFNLDEFITRE